MEENSNKKMPSALVFILAIPVFVISIALIILSAALYLNWLDSITYADSSKQIQNISPQKSNSVTAPDNSNSLVNDDDPYKAFMNEVETTIGKTMRELENIYGPGGVNCYLDNIEGINVVVCDYWVNDTDSLVAEHDAGIKVDGVSRLEALDTLSTINIHYYGDMPKYGINDGTGFMLRFLYNGDPDRVITYWVNGILVRDDITGYVKE